MNAGDVMSALVLGLGAFTGAATLAAKRRLRRRQYWLGPITTSAVYEAAVRGNELVTIEHLLLSSTFDPEVEEALRARGVALDVLRRQIEATLDPVIHHLDGDIANAARFDRRASSVIAVAEVGDETARELLTAIENGPASRGRDLLEQLAGRASVSERALDVAEATVSGPYRTAPAPRRQLRFWNNDKTQMHTVARLLAEHCGLGRSHARYLMLAIHFRGTAVVGHLSDEDVARAASRINAGTRAERTPPIVTVEPRGAPAPGFLSRLRHGLSR